MHTMAAINLLLRLRTNEQYIINDLIIIANFRDQQGSEYNVNISK